jgi:aminopeptidase-like protein
MVDEEYEVMIDSSLSDGSLSYGECVLPSDGGSSDEVLISCHVCHPSLANDNLSGLSVAVFLAKDLLARKRRYTYRFLFIPATIGAITWLAANREQSFRIAVPKSIGSLPMSCARAAARTRFASSCHMDTTSASTAPRALTWVWAACRGVCGASFPNITPRPTIWIS